MIVFILASLALVALALALLLPPLFGRSGGRAAGAAKASVVAVYTDQLADLDAELASGTLSKADHAAAREEIERRVISEAPDAAPAAAAASGSRVPAIAAAVLVPIVALAIYAYLGTPEAMSPQAVAASGAAGEHQVSKEQIDAMVGKLVARLKEKPDDAEGWVMLGRTMSFLERHREAADAYAKAEKLLPNDAQLLADYADALGMAQGRSLDGEPAKLVERAVKADPNNTKALALAGTLAFNKGDFKQAIAHWERLMPLLPADSPLRDPMAGGLAEARERLGLPAAKIADAGASKAAAGASPHATATPGTSSVPGGAAASVRGRVTLSAPADAAPKPEDTVFVIARTVGGPPAPVAVIKRQVKDLPFEFTLDDAAAMDPSRGISKVDKVILVARVSRSGSATRQAGDLEVTTQPVAVGSGGVELKIDQVVKP